MQFLRLNIFSTTDDVVVTEARTLCMLDKNLNIELYPSPFCVSVLSQ